MPLSRAKSLCTKAAVAHKICMFSDKNLYHTEIKMVGYSMEEEKTSEQGGVELCSNGGYSYDRPRSVASSGSTTSTLRELRRSAAAAHKGRRFKVAALLGVVFLVAIVLAIAIATSGAEDSITMNSSVGIDSSTENTE